MKAKVRICGVGPSEEGSRQTQDWPGVKEVTPTAPAMSASLPSHRLGTKDSTSPPGTDHGPCPRPSRPTGAGSRLSSRGVITPAPVEPQATCHPTITG